MRSFLLLPLLAALSISTVAASARAGADPDRAVALAVGEKPVELEGAEITDRLGQKAPLHAKFVDEDGTAVSLDKYLTGEAAGKPVLLTLGYFECPMLCNLVLNATVDGLAGIDLVPGRDFTIISVSINPKDTPVLAAAKKKTYLQDLRRKSGREIDESAWHFLVVGGSENESQVRQLADAVGFGYRYDAKTDNYAHGAGVFFLSPNGTLSHTIWGLNFAPKDVKFSLMDASEGKVGTAVDKVLLSCFQFGKDGKYSVYVWGVMRICALIMVLVVGTLLFLAWRRDRVHTTHTPV
jgi:protein SCO1/2